MVPRAARSALQRSLDTLIGQGGRHRALNAQLEFAALPRAAMLDEQRTRLRALIRHAATTVPYWRDAFADAKLDPNDFREVDDLAQLPILTKEIIRAEGDRLLSERVNRRALIERRTGGSTAEPLVFYVTRAEYEQQIATSLRGFALAGVRPGEPLGKIWGYNREQRLGNLIAPLTGRLFFDAYQTTPERMDRWVDHMQRIKPVCIYGYASALHIVARHISDRRATLPSVRVVASTAEKLFDGQRREIEAGFGAKVVDMYGCHEVPRLASECLEGSMHMALDAAVMEFVDDDTPGPSRRVLLTSLQSYAMPLIRYDVGDRARAISGTCTCGIELPLMAMDVGKIHHVFALPSGQRVHTSAFFKPLYTLDCLTTFQIQHRALDHIVVVAVPRPDRGAEASDRLAEVLRAFGSTFGPSVRFEAELVDTIPKTARGKQPIVTSQVSEDTSWATSETSEATT